MCRRSLCGCGQLGAADHTGRHVDRRHITDWPRWSPLRQRWTERRLSWCAILFVSRPSIHRARSARADCGPPVNPISCAACRRIRAIENCVSRLLPSVVQRQVTMLVALDDRLNPTSRRATLQPSLAYCATEFGRLFVRRLASKPGGRARPLRRWSHPASSASLVGRILSLTRVF
jgi:hypothetical protein